MLEFGNTGLSYIVQALILGQPIFFMALLYWKGFQLPEKLKYAFYGVGFVYIAWVVVSGWHIMFYTNHLWIQYTVLVLLAVLLYNGRYPIKEAVCLGFLTVYLNSYYWELPIHLADYINTFPNWIGNMGVFLPQFMRLMPLMYLLPNYIYSKYTWKVLGSGVVFSFIVMVLRITILADYRIILFTVNRFVCLILLVSVILNADKIEPTKK